MSASDFEERIVTVPLRDLQAHAKHERAGKAAGIVRAHLAKNFAVDEDEVRLDPSINEALWARSNKKPPSKVRVRAARFEEEGETVVEAEHADE
ncbi:MAG: 50S ribosomal protein L31e [Halarchaeum sp.]